MASTLAFEHPILGYLVLQGSEQQGLLSLDFMPVPIPHSVSDDPLLFMVKHQLQRYFKGEPVDFRTIPVAPPGTPFQQQVWNVLGDIPYGQTRSYGWVARQLGRPKACRAVGQANGKNPIPIIIPCHRVVQQDGALGGYSGGTWIKQFLLELEQAHSEHSAMSRKLLGSNGSRL